MRKINLLLPIFLFVISISVHAQEEFMNEQLSFHFTGTIVDKTTIVQSMDGQMVNVNYLILKEENCDILLTTLTPENNFLSTEWLATEFDFETRKVDTNVMYEANSFDVISGYNFSESEKKIYIVAVPKNMDTNSVFIFTHILDEDYKLCSPRGAKWVKEILGSLKIDEP